MHNKCEDAGLSLITRGWVLVYIMHACSYCTDVLRCYHEDIAMRCYREVEDTAT